MKWEDRANYRRMSIFSSVAKFYNRHFHCKILCVYETEDEGRTEVEESVGEREETSRDFLDLYSNWKVDTVPRIGRAAWKR